MSLAVVEAVKTEKTAKYHREDGIVHNIPNNRMKQFILGQTLSGQKFRPSDWVNRLATIGATFGQDKKLVYNKYLVPCTLPNISVPVLMIHPELKENNPELYEFILNFAKSNNLEIL